MMTMTIAEGRSVGTMPPLVAGFTLIEGRRREGRRDGRRGVLGMITALVFASSIATASTSTLYNATSGLPPAFPQWISGSAGGTPTSSVVGSSYFDLSTAASNSTQVAYQLLSPALVLDPVAGFEVSGSGSTPRDP